MQYTLLNQTVTLYNKLADGVHRTVLRGGARLELGREWAQDGDAGTGMLLLVHPGQCGARYLLPAALAALNEGERAGCFTLQKGDKALLGEGPEITPAEWPRFLPALQSGLGVIGSASEVHGPGGLMHIEAGGLA